MPGLVLLTAEPEVIRQRMADNSHPGPKTFFQAEDAERLLARFQEEFDASLIRRWFVLDTSDTTPEETLQAFAKQMKKHLTDADRIRILTNRLVDVG